MNGLSSTPRAFVLMPFAPEFDATFCDLIMPALTGYEVSRADTRLDERGVLEKIITGIRDAALIVADVSNSNPNVMYELGVAHTMGKPTIMIAQSAANLPFDIGSYTVHEYPPTPERRSTTLQQLRQLAEAYRQGLIVFANPVTDFAPSVSSALAPILKAGSPYSPHDFVDDFEAAMTFIGSFDVRLSAIAKKHTRQLAVALPRIVATPRSGLSLFDNEGVAEAADCTRSFAADLNDLSSEFHAAWDRFGRAMRWMLSAEIRPHIADDRRHSFAATAQTIDEHLNGTLGDLAELRRVQEAFPHHSGNLSHAFSVARDAITALLNEIMTAKGYLARIRAGA
ncbi:MAG: hypothetical protein ACXW5U_24980 [Thermoanaerobaculia bacterium]